MHASLSLSPTTHHGPSSSRTMDHVAGPCLPTQGPVKDSLETLRGSKAQGGERVRLSHTEPRGVCLQEGQGGDRRRDEPCVIIVASARLLLRPSPFGPRPRHTTQREQAERRGYGGLRHGRGCRRRALDEAFAATPRVPPGWSRSPPHRGSRGDLWAA